MELTEEAVVAVSYMVCVCVCVCGCVCVVCGVMLIVLTEVVYFARECHICIFNNLTNA